jgi:hypothetical protein
MTQARSALGFGVILAACLGGAFDLSAWTIVVATAALLLISLTHHQPHYARYSGQGNVSAQSMLLLGSALNAATASTVAFAVGRAIAWLWGI